MIFRWKMLSLESTINNNEMFNKKSVIIIDRHKIVTLSCIQNYSKKSVFTWTIFLDTQFFLFFTHSFSGVLVFFLLN